MSVQDLNTVRNPFITLLKACGQKKDLYEGIRLHADIQNQGLLETNPYIASSLVSMYAKCGALAESQQVFDTLPFRDLVSWSALIAGYTQNGRGEAALHCFAYMQQEGLSPNVVLFTTILKACGSIGAADKGKQIHDEILSQGMLGKSVVLGNALVDMYVKCGALPKAQQVFYELPVRDVVTWSALISGYAHRGEGERALECFSKMQGEGHCPNAVTFLCILKACGSIGAADKGKQVHDEMIRQGMLTKDVMLGSALVDMYAKCGALARAQGVLDNLHVRNVVSWNALITGYVQQGKGKEALKCFERMQREGICPNGVTFACILKACGGIGEADKGKNIHDEIVSQGLLGKSIVLDSSLVDMYVKCGALKTAQKLLDKLPARNIVSWSSLITGYAKEGKGDEALNCYERMQDEGICPDMVTFSCILKACGAIGAAEKGKHIHDEIMREGFLGKSLSVDSALVDMYAKCGSLATAQQILDELPVRDVVSWNALIAGYAQHMQVAEALICFERMQQEGHPPDSVTYLNVLNACSRSGLVVEGRKHFKNMVKEHGITPSLEHYTCIVDLFSRRGHFDNALTLIERMPLFDDPQVWSALLGACQKWGSVELAKWAFGQAIQLDEN